MSMEVEGYQGCISFDSYIKPQRRAIEIQIQQRCISFDSYIKPQHDERRRG